MGRLPPLTRKSTPAEVVERMLFVDAREERQRAAGMPVVLTAEWGQFYGFPQCCIDAFKTYGHVGQAKRKLTGTGYIPCLACNEKSEAELLAAIEARRNPAAPPFPAGDPLKDKP